ncbi:MAG: extracellular solute-binding protein [Nitrospinota bacterium]
MRRKGRVTRREFLKKGVVASTAVATGVSILPRRASAKPSQLVVALWGGAYGRGVHAAVGKRFQKETGIRVVYEYGVGGPRHAKLRATRGNPVVDVAFFEFFRSIPALKEGLIEPPNYEAGGPVPNAAKLSKPMKLPQGYGLWGDGFGLAYHRKAKKAPQAWADLWDSAYRKDVGVHNPSQNRGLMFLVMAAIVGGGDERNIDPGFERLKALKPNTAAVITSIAEAQTGFSQQLFHVTGFWNSYINSWRDGGLKVFYKYPRERAVGMFDTISVVKGISKDRRQSALKFINLALSAEAQAQYASKSYWVPGNPKALPLVPQSTRERLLSQEQIEQSRILDWELVISNQEKWARRFEKILS